MSSEELEEIVVTPMVFGDGHKVGDPKAHPGSEIEYVFEGQNRRGIVNIVKVICGDWAYPVNGVPGFLRSQSILEATPGEVDSAIRIGDKYNIIVSYNGERRPAIATVVTRLSLGSNSQVYLRIDDSGDLCSVQAEILLNAKPIK